MGECPLVPIILDACCLLNLYASGRLKEIAKALPEPLVVSDYVLEKEALSVRYKESDQDEEQKKPVDITPLLSAGLIKVISINSEKEQETFIDLATELDDGEAITVSLAEHRGCQVATDDRKALKVISERASVQATSTLELVKRWAEARNVSREEIRSVLALIWTGASYYPGERDPLYIWWRDMMSETKEANNKGTTH
jgi:predicted nucleic acid-binding protein